MYKRPINFTYEINEKTLVLVNYVKDLGITLSNNLSFSKHISKYVVKQCEF